MTVHSMCVGAATHESMRFNVKVTGSGPVGVAVADNPDMVGAVLSPTVAQNAYKAGTVEVTGLEPGTRYWWRGNDSGIVDQSVAGTFLTDPGPPGDPASFTIGLWGDAGLTPVVPGVGTQVPHRSSFHPGFGVMLQRALAEGWLRVVSLGDEIYYNLGSGSFGLPAAATASQYRSQWDDIFAHAVRHELYRSVPWVYLWDDHDYAQNDSDSTAPGRDNACTVYRERCPSYLLPAGTGAAPIYHSFVIGRVLFIASDTRSDRLRPTMLGSAQLAWLEGMLAASDADALVWLMPTPWNDTREDTWGGFVAERNTVRQMLGDYGWLGRMQMMTADIHAAAIDSGANNRHGGFPITLCASMDATISGPNSDLYDVAWRPGRGQYATLRVDDHGGDIVVSTAIWRGHRQLAGHYTNIPT